MPEQRLVLVGYAGRDQAAVQAHVDELAAHGVPVPREVPAVWEVPASLLSSDAVVKVDGAATSGEAEPVLLLRDDGTFLAVGSDHTDRDLERTDMDAAKAACPKLVSPDFWALPDVRDEWDAIELRSDVLVDGGWRPYQQATLSELLEPEWYLSHFDAPAVVFCGTVPAADGLVTDATAFRAELRRPNGEVLRCEYEIGRG